MFELNGKHNSCKIYADIVDNETISQLTTLLNQEAISGSNIAIMPDCHAGKGAVIGTTMTLKDRVMPALVGVDIGCLDKDSEVLTLNGWIKICDYNGQEILVYDKATGNAFFDLPYAYIKQPCDEFLYFHNDRGLDLAHSKEHKMLVYSGFKDEKLREEIVTAEEFFQKIQSLKREDYYSIKTVFDYNSDGFDMEDNILRLLIAESMCSSLIVRGKACYSEFQIEDCKKADRLKDLLEKCSIPYDIKPYKGFINISFVDNRICTKDWRFLYYASRKQLEIAVDELSKWYQTTDEYGRVSYKVDDKRNADVIQWMFACLGVRADIEVCDQDETPYCSVCLAESGYVTFGANKTTYDNIKSKDGFKYCFTTSTGFFVMRRNYNICVTGNCGMRVIKLEEKRVDLPKLDAVIHKYVPSGFTIHEEAIAESGIGKLYAKGMNIERAMCSLGSLGGGNHFVELDKGEDGSLYLVIHTGSRHLGIEVCNYYMERGYEEIKEKMAGGSLKDMSKELVARLKAEKRDKEISKALEKLKKEYKVKNPSIPYDLAYVEGKLFDDYIHDMKITQEHAVINRETIARLILKNAKLHAVEEFETIHNYIDTEHMVLRKGAVSAQAGEKLLIPLNMRDGSLICIGKGNAEWNCSAPHGAGRIMSRSVAKDSVSMSDFKKSMEGIYTTCVNRSTIDESPMAYKPMESIINNIGDTVDIVERIVPIYNFKASESGD